MKFGARQANLRMNEVETLRAAKRLGFDGAELVIGMDYADSPLFTTEGVAEVKAVAKETGMGVPCICVGVLNKIGLGREDGSMRQEAASIVEKSIEAAAAVGAGGLLIPFFGDSRIEDADASARAIEELSKLAPKAEEAGITLAVECTLDSSATWAIINGVGSPAVMAYFDMANALYYGHDPLAEIRGLGEAIWMVHVKDATSEAIVPLSEGQVDVKAVLQALRSIGYDGWLVFETKLQGDLLEALGNDLAYVKERV